MKKTVFGIALVLALALLLFAAGWLCGHSAAGGDVTVRQTIVAEAQSLQQRMETRFDRIEGKIDALLRIATTPPSELKPVK